MIQTTNVSKANYRRSKNSYENQLVALCGSVKDGSGQSKPAVPKYIQHFKGKQKVDNPCGLTQSGQLYNSYQQLGKFQIRVRSAQQTFKNTVAQIEAEKFRIQNYCKKKFELADITWEHRKKVHKLNQQIGWIRYGMDAVSRTVQNMGTAFSLWKCGLTECPSAAIAFGFFTGISVVSEAMLGGMQAATIDKQNEIAEQSRKFEQRQMTISCDSDGTARVDSMVRVLQLRNQLLVIELETLQMRYDVSLALSQIKGIQDKVIRIIAQQEQVTQQAINIQAARNDPNIRIYQNDAIIAAEYTFNLAMQAAYETTLVYEYYTGSSYRDKNKLFFDTYDHCW